MSLLSLCWGRTGFLHWVLQLGVIYHPWFLFIVIDVIKIREWCLSTWGRAEGHQEGVRLQPIAPNALEGLWKTVNFQGNVMLWGTTVIIMWWKICSGQCASSAVTCSCSESYGYINRSHQTASSFVAETSLFRHFLSSVIKMTCIQILFHLECFECFTLNHCTLVDQNWFKCKRMLADNVNVAVSWM